MMLLIPSIRGKWRALGLPISLYIYIGIAIVTNRLMEAIGLITDKSRNVTVRDSKSGETKVLRTNIWNKTVANLTLVCFASYAPEFLLSMVEMYAKHFKAGDLGPNTVLGSYAFNIIFLVGLCVTQVPKNKIKLVKNLPFILLSSALNFVTLLWLVCVLSLISYGTIEWWEGLMTMILGVCVIVAYWGAQKATSAKVKSEDMLEMASALESAETSVQSSSDPAELVAYRLRCTEFNEAVKSLIQETPDIPPQDLDVLACQKVIAQEPKAMPFYYIQALRLITGKEDLDDILQKHIANKLSNDKNAVDDILRLGRVSDVVGQQSWKEQFTSAIKKRESGGVSSTILHFLTMPWNLLAALVPPPTILLGIPSILLSLVILLLLVTILGDLLEPFGNQLGVPQSLIGLCFNGVGLSISGTMACIMSAKVDKTGDDTLSFILGSSNVKTLLLLSTPWTLASVYWASEGQDFLIYPNGLENAAIMLMLATLVVIAVLLIRRFTTGGELGGSTASRLFTTGFLAFLWLIYIVMNILLAYQFIRFDFFDIFG